MNKKQKLVVVLLIVAIALSVISIGIGVSFLGTPAEFNFISSSSKVPISNIGVTIENPDLESEDGS
jgi:flagellar basal body-associated protein FliL